MVKRAAHNLKGNLTYGSLLLFTFTLFAGCDYNDNALEVNLDRDILLVATSKIRWTGVAVSRTRRFACYPNWSADHSASVIDLTDTAHVVPFPDEAWNTWADDSNPADHFICVQSVVADKNDFLWVLDAANSQREGEYLGVLSGGAKLVKFDLQTSAVVQKIIFPDSVVKKNSYLNDVRIDEDRHMAYITDSNEGALLVVDLLQEHTRRVLDGDPSTQSENKILYVEGMPFKNAKGEYPQIHVDGIALNETHVYYRPLTGEGLYRIPKYVLNSDLMTETELRSHVEKLGSFPPSDGMMFGFYDELYLTSIEENAIRAYGNGNYTRLIKKRDDLKWPDSFSLGPDGYLYFTTSQLHLQQPAGPFKLFKIDVRHDR